jgi:TP901 family phage tail tape measure protein
VANTVTITVDADTKKADKNITGMGTKFRSAMKGVAMAAGGVALAAGAAAKLGEEYQEATNTIAAGTGASGEQLEGLIQSFKDVSSGVPQDFAAVSSAIADVNTEMGLEGEALEDVTKAFLDVSRAMGEDAAPMIKQVADALIAFDTPASDARSVLDKLTTASQNAGVPITALAKTMVDFGPQLSDLGLPMDDAIALIANMEAAGINAGKMMPGLNKAIGTLAKEGVTDISAGLQEMIDGIQNAETDSEGLALAVDAFGAGAGVRFKDAIDKGAFSLDDMLEAMGNSEDKVADLGAKTLTMSDKMDIMKNKVKGALSPIGNMATALGPMVIMIPALATGIAAMASSQLVATAATWLQTAATAALNVAMGPIGLIIIGIVLAIAGIILAFKNWDKIVLVLQKTWDTVWGAIKTAFDTVLGLIESVFNSKFGWLLPGGALMKALNLLRDNWKTIWNGMKDVVKAIANPIIGVVNTVIGAVNALFDAMRKVELGWDEKKIGIGKLAVTIPGFNFAPFKGLPTIPTIPKLAAGGIVRSPTLAMLGEAGPEAVIPLGRGGGMGITINILGPTYGFDDFEQRVSEAISDGVRRGGFSGILAPA